MIESNINQNAYIIRINRPKVNAIDSETLIALENEIKKATEDIETKYTGSEIEIGFNSKYILDMINNLDDEEINLNFKDAASPVIVKEESNPDLIYVLMPMRV